jgi:uncharacterized protein (TIGR02145 family)
MTRREFVNSILVASGGILISCSKSPAAPDPPPVTDSPTVTDTDGNVYRTVRIGTQLWMAENLKPRRGAGGTALSEVYAYGDLEGNVATYGRLYTWNTAMMPLIAGWHLPSDAEWTTLINAVGVASAGTLLRQGGSSGFNVPFGGVRQYDGTYVGLGGLGECWSSTPLNADHANTVTFWPNQAQVERTGWGFIGGASVRLVRDN